MAGLRRGPDLQEWLRAVGHASAEIQSNIFPHMDVKTSGFPILCCCSMAKNSAKAYRELWLAGEALSTANHEAEDGNHSEPAVEAAKEVESAMGRLYPLGADSIEKPDHLQEDGPKYPPEVESVQSANRRDTRPNSNSSLPLIPAALLASWLLPDSLRHRESPQSREASSLRTGPARGVVRYTPDWLMDKAADPSGACCHEHRTSSPGLANCGSSVAPAIRAFL
mmetsp:Transcript_3140/g.5330  ORF Transcript_3140/g.5330 Transcript_3140/m.5330 type:complete len:224 (-) Transcript_3140:38-709(-)